MPKVTKNTFNLDEINQNFSKISKFYEEKDKTNKKIKQLEDNLNKLYNEIQNDEISLLKKKEQANKIFKDLDKLKKGESSSKVKNENEESA